MFVLVTGPPASGKTTLSTALAAELGLPRLAKDTIKHGLLQVLDAPDVAASRTIGAAAVRALLAVASENSGAVLDSVWVSPDSVVWLQALPGPIVEVFCQCDLDELRRRHRARADDRRGREHDVELDRPETERWNAGTMRPVAGGWPVLRLDTASAVDLGELAERLRDAQPSDGR